MKYGINIYRSASTVLWKFFSILWIPSFFEHVCVNCFFFKRIFILFLSLSFVYPKKKLYSDIPKTAPLLSYYIFIAMVSIYLVEDTPTTFYSNSWNRKKVHMFKVHSSGIPTIYIYTLANNETKNTICVCLYMIYPFHWWIENMQSQYTKSHS